MNTLNRATYWEDRARALAEHLTLLNEKSEEAARERKNALNGLRRYEFTTRVQKRTANDPEERDTDLFVRWKEVEPWI